MTLKICGRCNGSRAVNGSLTYYKPEYVCIHLCEFCINQILRTFKTAFKKDSDNKP